MRKRNKWLSGVSMLLVLAMIAGVWAILSGAGYVEPDASLPAQPQAPTPEALGEGGTLPSITLSESPTQPTENEEPTPTEVETSESTEPQTPETSEPTEQTTAPTEPETTEPTSPLSEPSTKPDSSEPTAEKTEEPTIAPTELPDVKPDDTPQEPTSATVEPSVVPTVSPSEPSTSPEPTESGEPQQPDDGTSVPDDGEVKIVTDLRSRQLTQDDLPDGIFEFYAYPSVDNAAYGIKVVVRNSATPQNGSPLQSTDGRTYCVTLPLNETTDITLYLKKGDENLAYVRYQLRYDAKKADENAPEVGENPPTILTSLDGYSGTVESHELVVWVSARTEPEGEPIRADQIEVWLNDTLLSAQTGDTRPEYLLYFGGESAVYTVKVVAWDGKGNSAMKQYTLEYRAVGEDEVLGDVTVILDATTVGLGILDSGVFEIRQGDSAASAVIRFLEEYGYDADYDGTAEVGFYLRSVGRADLCSGAAIPDSLWLMIERDGIALSGYSDPDSLSEYDYTMGAGWMYAIDGSVFPSRGLSDYPLSGNTTVCLRFTLAYGKDIGGYDSGHGALSGYCGAWINGGYTPLEHDLTETDRLDATETEDGYVEYTCARCGEVIRETIPALGTQPTAFDTPRRRRRTNFKRTMIL